MPANKDFKRLVRARMMKTGESYTAARSKLVRKPPEKINYAKLAGMTDAAIKTKTGCTWERWTHALDYVGAQEWPHRQIADYVHEKFKVGDWWSQTVTVGYERIKGLRAIGQRRDGTFEAAKSKTFGAPLARLYRSWSDAKLRGKWLPEALTIRSKTPQKYMRITWSDGTPVQLVFTKKGAAKSAVAVQHTKLSDRAAVTKMKAFWEERLKALGNTLLDSRNTMRRILLLACAVVFASPVAAQQRHTITHEDVYLSKRVGSPAISPDGRWVVFSVTEPSYTEGEQVSDLWIVSLDGSAPSEPRRLTNSKGGESGVDWSSDSRRIAFSARREGDEAAQIYVLDLSGGGEAQRVTTISTGASNPLWRPDGRAILFSSMVYPGATTDSANRAAAAERRGRKYNARVYDASPIRLWDRWLDDRKPSLFVQTLEPGAAARSVLAGSRLAAGAGFGGQLGNSGDDLSATWTPDGSGVVFAATTNRGDWTHGDVTNALWLVSANGGEPQRLTQGKDDYDNPEFSPDGRTLYAGMTPTNEHTFNNRRLVSWAWPRSGAPAPQVVAGGANHSVGAYAFAPDGRAVFFLSEDGGHQRLFRAATTGTAGEREVGTMTSGTFTGLQVATGTTGNAVRIAAVWESATSPPEIARIDPATGRGTPLTKFNTERAARIDWQPLRDFSFTASSGKRIHSFVALPPAFDSTRRYPLFVLIHGGAANMWTDNFGLRWNPHLLGAAGYVVLMTDYRGSTGYGEKFSQDIQFDPLEGPANDINEAADSAIKRFRFIDGSKQVAGGASYGGHLTNWLAVTTTRYRALVSHAGEWDLETQWATSDFNYDRERNVGGPPWEDHALWKAQSPMRRAKNLHTPVLVSVGERDFRVPMNNALEFWTALQRQQIPSKLIVWPDENHWVLKGENSRFFYREVAAWLARWLSEPAASGQ